MPNDGPSPDLPGAVWVALSGRRFFAALPPAAVDPCGMYMSSCSSSDILLRGISPIVLGEPGGGWLKDLVGMRGNGVNDGGWAVDCGM